VGYPGTIEFDPARPDGSPRKLIDSAKLSVLGWQPKMRLADGVAETYRRFMAEHSVVREDVMLRAVAC
jgi:GDP-L-fucose synthase